MPLFPALQKAIASAGLATRGVLTLDPSQRVGPLAEARAVVLLGMVGSAQWPGFARSPEALDGAPHPLDRWSQRVICALAEDWQALALFPFGGPPYWPFLTWARAAEPVWPSPLGLLVHPEHGLWHSYRGALVFRDDMAAPPAEGERSPCEVCATKPCLGACPVQAFTGAGYDVDACVVHVRGTEGRECRELGCLARRACPIGRHGAHVADQARFHMRAFLAAR
jgi:hypothetical protein